MNVKVSLPINASKESIWKVISNIEESEKNIKAINKIEILEKPSDGLVGLKWRETRTMFGKEATEVMWVTDSNENSFYKTRAESHGMVYISELKIEGNGDMNTLTMGFFGEAQRFGGKLMSVIFGGMMKKSTEKALMVDLEDIKKISEE